MNLMCTKDPEHGFTIIIDLDTGKEVHLDYESFPCRCSYPARLVGVNCYYESYKCDRCGNTFTVK